MGEENLLMHQQFALQMLRSSQIQFLKFEEPEIHFPDELNQNSFIKKKKQNIKNKDIKESHFKEINF